MQGEDGEEEDEKEEDCFFSRSSAQLFHSSILEGEGRGRLFGSRRIEGIEMQGYVGVENRGERMDANGGNDEGEAGCW